MTRPVISIIVPVYNVEPYIARCLDSLVNQTFGDIEIICINDGSPDNSLKICEEYAKRDSRILIFSQANQGLSAARNIGLSHARGEYIQFCDSDDYYDLTMCEKMYNAITASNADIVASGTKVIYDSVPVVLSDEEYYRIKFKGLRNVNLEIIQGTDVSVWNKIFKKIIIDKYNIKFPFGLNNEDACFFIKYLFVSKTIYYLTESFYMYVRRPGSIMSNALYQKTPRALDHVDIIYDIISFMEQYGLKKKYENILVWIIIAYTYHAIHYGTEAIYRAVFDKGASFCKDIDFNSLVNGNYNKDDIIRLYAFKKNNPEMYFSVDKTNAENEKVRNDLNQSRTALDKARNTIDVLRTRTADTELQDKKYFFFYLIKSCFLFPWYIYKTYRMVYNCSIQKIRVADFVKAYLFMPYFVLKMYRTILRRSEFLG